MMRNSKHFALGAATLLLSTAGFTACSSEDTFTGGSFSGESVKTQFAISIPATGKVNNRMGQDIVQGSGQFRGMTNIRLVPFSLGDASADSPLTGSETMLYNAISLGDITNDGLKDNSNAKLYTDVDIPLNTNAFLFYGEALEAGGSDDATNGVIVPSYESTGLAEGTAINTLSFSLKGVLGTKTVTDAENNLLNILNGLAAVTTDGGTAWSAGTGIGDLSKYYDSFISLKAGSANNILLAIQDLYNAMNSSLVDDNSTGLKAKIIEEINKSFDKSGSDGQYTLTYKESNVGKTFPVEFGLPDGAVQVKWNSGISKFEYITEVEYDGSGSNLFNVASLDKYVYPASLYYWVNTNIKTSNSSQEAAYDGVKDWDDILVVYDDGTTVTSSTQSIVLKQAINYAVGRFDIYAQFADGEIKDNATSAKVVTIPTEGFTLKGVLIGGQKAVKWNFETNTGADEYTVYDSKVNAGITRTSESTLANSTLVLETQSRDGDKVNFALEFVNNGSEPFTGADGIIPVNGKFYLVGQLTSQSPNTNVFKQDHYTKATVTINSLKNAYNCIPDLRSPKLELGLSVDLEWQPGLVDNVTIE